VQVLINTTYQAIIWIFGNHGESWRPVVVDIPANEKCLAAS
jgi:hypothetical protein